MSMDDMSKAGFIPKVIIDREFQGLIPVRREFFSWANEQGEGV